MSDDGPPPTETSASTASDASTESVEDVIAELVPGDSTAKRVRKIVLRIFFVVLALGISAWILVATFDDIDLDAILEAARSLDDAETISLVSMWLLWIGAQGLLTASLVPGLPVRRGVVAFLGPAGVTMVVPGPSDLPVRYRMLTSWGRTTGEATLSVAAGGIFSIGIKLVLPVVAAIGLLVSDAPIDGTLRTVVAICLVVGLVMVAAAFVFGSAKRTEQAGGLLGPIWATVMRLLRKPEPPDLAAQMLGARTRAVHTLRERWLVASWATVLTAASKFALLLMTLRFTGMTEAQLSWTEIFVVFALVQGLTVIPISAGDAGVSEIAYIGLLTAAAGSEYVNQISAAVLIFRVLTWLLIIPVGLATLGFWKMQLRRHPPPAPAM